VRSRSGLLITTLTKSDIILLLVFNEVLRYVNYVDIKFILVLPEFKVTMSMFKR